MSRCGLLLLMFRGLCVCLLVTTVSCVKMAEPIMVPFRVTTLDIPCTLQWPRYAPILPFPLLHLGPV